LRLVKNLSDAEVELIVRSISENLRTYEQIIEVSILIPQTAGTFRDYCAQLLAYMPLHAGGLQPLSFCLFHQHESIREATVDIFNELRQYPVCRRPNVSMA